MDIFANAPLALLEVDRLSSDSSNLPASLRDGVSNCPYSVLSSSTDQLDFDVLCSGSLSDLILNFDDLVHSPLVSGTKCAKDESDGRKALQDVTLCEVKFWWKEALENPCPLQYPLGEPPSKLGSYDDFESADVDGITEDGEPDALPDRFVVPLKSHPSGESVNSFRGHVTTDSECSSTCVEHDTSGETDSAAATSVNACSESVSDLSPGYLKSSSRLLQLSVERLKSYLDTLTANIMQLSDGLLELLATRDELLMLREASDDFIILLNLVHQRRSRASRAALMATARARMRLRGFSRFRFPWPPKNLFTTNACSLSSLRENLLSSKTTNVPYSAQSRGVRLEPLDSGDSVALNSSDCVAAYHKSLNLQSKHRRPKTQPITTGTMNIRKTQCTFQNGTSPLKESHAAEHEVIGDNDENAIPMNYGPSVSNERAHERLLALKHLCNNLAWPHGQPQMSQSLSVTLPIDVSPGDGITLAKLRIINRILHGTLLENPDIVQLITAYTQAVNRKHDVVNWVNGETAAIQVSPDPAMMPGITNN